jgi:hypothetical protein
VLGLGTVAPGGGHCIGLWGFVLGSLALLYLAFVYYLISEYIHCYINDLPFCYFMMHLEFGLLFQIHTPDKDCIMAHNKSRNLCFYGN